jgi:RES domain-containing protein
MVAYRIADARYPIFDPTGAMLSGGRWNSIGQRAIYAAETYAGAMLEVLVHANLSVLPKNHRVVSITFPDQLQIETVVPDALPGWNSEDLTATREFGDRWLQELRTPILRVPSVITEGRECNILFNTSHPQFALVQASSPQDVHWDIRLFSQVSKKNA